MQQRNVAIAKIRRPAKRGKPVPTAKNDGARVMEERLLDAHRMQRPRLRLEPWKEDEEEGGTCSTLFCVPNPRSRKAKP